MDEFDKSTLLVVLFEVYLIINCIVNLILTVALTYLTIRLYRAVNHFFYKQKGQMHKILIILAIIILIVSILSVIGDFLFCFIGQVKKHSSEESTPTSYFRGFNIECAAGWIAPLLLNLLYISNYRSNACSSYLKIISEELEVNDPEEVNKHQAVENSNQTTSSMSFSSRPGIALAPEEGPKNYIFDSCSQKSSAISSVSRGLLLPNQVLLERHAVICQALIEDPDISDGRTSTNQQ